MHGSKHVLLAAANLLVLACARATSAPPAAAASAASAASAPAPLVPDTILAANEREALAVLARIGDRKNDSASKVFTNVRHLTGSSAQTLLTIMNIGYARALGVRCAHCHVEGDYASDAKRPKRAAREMAVMHRTINETLRKMESLDRQPVEARNITCTTCHRGRLRPQAP